MIPSDLTNDQIEDVKREALKRGLLLVDLADVEPARLAAAVMASPEARSAMGRLMVAKRGSKHGQKPVDAAVVAKIRAERAKGDTMPVIAARHGISVRTVARYADPVNRKATAL